MSKDPEIVCVACMAEKVASHVLTEFTEMHPDVKMSYDAWMSLGVLIEETIKEAMGVDEHEGETGEKVTVQ